MMKRVKWWRRLLHWTHIKPDGWLIVQAYTQQENDAIDIFNGWSQGFLSRAEAIELVTQERFKDKGARLWHDQIWKKKEFIKSR